MSDVFMSYKSEERPLVETIIRTLINLGLDVWYDQELETGRAFDDQLESKLRSAKAVVVCWSRRAIESPWVMREANWADLNKIIVPLLLEDVLPPGPFARIEAAKLIGWRGEADHPEWILLLRRLEILLRRTDLVEKEQDRAARETAAHVQSRKAIHFRAERASRTRRRILSIDGGGVRSVISLAHLARIEKVLAARSPDPLRFRLSDYFDLIGGTSVGAIIAAGLSMGRRVGELNDFLKESLPRWYRKGASRDRYVHGDSVCRDLEAFFGDIGIGSELIKTGLAVCVKRVDVGNFWVITNNPQQQFWDTQNGGAYRSVRIVRLLEGAIGSTAQPDMRNVELFNGEPGAWMMDGALGGMANPSMILLMSTVMATFGQYWTLGSDNMFIVSVGSGQWGRRVLHRSNGKKSRLADLQSCLDSFVADTVSSNLAVMQFLGECERPTYVNPDFRALGRDDRVTNFPPLFRFERFDTFLTRDQSPTARYASQKKAFTRFKHLREQRLTVSEEIKLLSQIAENSDIVGDGHFPRSFDVHYEAVAEQTR